jgi:glycosyltransferase involved in cell wall biosynthesis
MKILLCHTYYHAQRGGEDRSFEEERALLDAGGHEVIQYVRHNDEVTSKHALSALATTLWNRRAASEVAEIVRRQRPDVLHATNTFPLISPSVLHAAHRGGTAVVQALRNYRLLCAGTYLMRNNKPCEDCLGKIVPWPAIKHRCYRDSASASAAVVGMQLLHRAIGTWRRKVDAFFTLTEFARGKFIQAGWPTERIHVKYNAVHPDPGASSAHDDYVVFAGRLSPEKGITILLEAWRRDKSLPCLKVAGDGPLTAEVAKAAAADSRIEFVGHLREPDVYRMFGRARAVIVPSLWYETFGRTIAEAFAVGTPVVASRLGAMEELVADGCTGYHFTAGDAADLAAKVRAIMQLSDDESSQFRCRARAEFDARYNSQQSYARLIEIYEIAIRAKTSRNASLLRSHVEIPGQIAQTATS